MSQSAQSLPRHAIRTSPYADRVRSTRVSATSYEIRIDGEFRFLIEGDEQWPALWQLFAVINGVRSGKCLTLESEHFDVIEQLERGCFWMPAAKVAPAPHSSSLTRHRFPQYLPE
ncbi:hypothetical protein [Pandoraea cepalis]|uniref:Uncharacterized protein n=1 Tax=Pandoraea cepalis TaxID=2508294 RepID=A0A5E4VX91_9BURK|nr:hypothetical protein [Pandoraea cepalis]VVE17028.1 hypothetical protein PCE31107_02949 [Pandoraea cepalis]